MATECKLYTSNMDPVLIPCTKCVSGKKKHNVLARFEEHGSEDDSRNSFHWTHTFAIVQCGGCETVSYRSTTSNSEDYDFNDDGMYYTMTEKLYPPRTEGRVSLDEEAWYLPANIRAMYDEVLVALSSQSPVLTGIGLRALLEAVCKEKKAKGRSLEQKITWLQDNHVLTPSGAGILHHIRNLGNKAAHEVKPHSNNELELALEVVEHLLKDVYILPKRAQVVFEKEEPTPPPVPVLQPGQVSLP